MEPARIAELLQPFLIAPFRDANGKEYKDPAVLYPIQLEYISTYIDILLRWNSRINLTAIRDPDEIVTRHFGESLFAARVLFPGTTHVGTATFGRPGDRSSLVNARAAEKAAIQSSATNREGHDLIRAENELVRTGALAPEGNDQQLTTNEEVADVGSGAGFPGIPLKLWNPAIHLTLIESNHKKATFLRELVRALTLTDIDIQSTRVETLPPASFDVVTLRAVERFDRVLSSVAALLKPAARLALLIGGSQLEIARATLPHLTWSPPVPIPDSTSRVVITAVLG